MKAPFSGGTSSESESASSSMSSVLGLLGSKGEWRMEFLSKTQRCRLTSFEVERESFVLARVSRLQG